MKRTFITIHKKRVVTDKFGNVISYPELVWITNYEWLKTLPQNRLISRAAVKKLGKSIVELGMLRAVVLVRINYVYYVADGQHAIEHLSESNLPTYAFIIDADTIEETMKIITTLNNTSRGWSLTQYVRGWAVFNNEYGKLMDLKKKYGLNYSLLGALLLGTTQYLAKKAIKDGTFTERADSKRITKLLNFMYNFELKTGIQMKHTHTAGGLAVFIIKTGLDEYQTIENKFIDLVLQHNKNTPIPVFARQSDSEDLWMRILSLI